MLEVKSLSCLLLVNKSNNYLQYSVRSVISLSRVSDICLLSLLLLPAPMSVCQSVHH